MGGTLVGFRWRVGVFIAACCIQMCIGRASVSDDNAWSIKCSHLMQVALSKTQLPLSGSPGVSKPVDNVCRTKGCLDIAEIYRKNMDLSVDPCDDFYKFSCGGFVNATPIPNDEFEVSGMMLAQHEVNKQLRSVIEAPMQPNEPKYVRLVKNYYKACMNEDEIDVESPKSLHEIFKKFGEWSLIGGAEQSDSNFDWKRSMYEFREAGLNSYLITISVETNIKNTTKRLIEISHPRFTMTSMHFEEGFQGKYMQSFHNVMVETATILGADRDRAMREIKDAMLFELKLYNMTNMVIPTSVKDGSNVMTFAELKNNYPSIPWAECFARLLPSGDPIKEDQEVNVPDPTYLTSMASLMEVTSKRVLQNYAMMQLVDFAIEYLNRDVQAALLKMRMVIYEYTKRKPRWVECIKDVAAKLPVGVNALYVQGYSNKETKTNVYEIIEDIKNRFTKTFKEVDWMDTATRKKALEKLAAMSFIVGYPDDILNVDQIDKYYEDLELSGNKYLENFINCSKFSNKEKFAKLHEPMERIYWTKGEPTAVDALYDLSDNTFEICLGGLQGVFFGYDRPKYVNYGATGYTIGHEMSHGFDPRGSRHDKDGNLNDWWPTTTKEIYENRTKCLIAKYGNYTAQQIGLKLTGKKSLNENFADISGLWQAYLAYENRTSRNPPEKRLPGFDYTPKQMFWISFANSWCTTYTNEQLKFVIKLSSYSPPEFRVIGSVSNIPQFSEDFNCPIGSKMNPIKKCPIW